MRKLVLHIPHSSINIPIKDGFIVDENIIQSELNKLTDWYTDELFDSPNDIIIRADFSRIFCDPERFIDDKVEVMSKYGMGVIYDRTDSGDKMREVDFSMREYIINNFYIPHHNKLTDSVQAQLDKFGSALIIDCHSFSNEPFIRDIDKKPNRPDINIGTDDFHTPIDILNRTVKYFENCGYSIGINWPYSGTIVPSKYYKKSIQVYSIMIEINRKLYIDNVTYNKSKNYNTIKQAITYYLDHIKKVL